MFAMKLSLTICLLLCLKLVSSADFDCKVRPQINVTFLDCCPVYSGLDNPEMSRIIKKCDAETSCDSITCAFKEFNIFNDNGELDKDLMNKFGAKLENPDVVNDYLIETANNCWKSKAPDTKCKNDGFAECVVKEISKNCSKSKIWNLNKIEDCNTIKQFMDNCRGT